MKPFSDYDKTQAYGNFETLPKGGYVVKILNAEEQTAVNGNKFLAISCDIVEGEYQSFYKNSWNSDTREDKKWGCVAQVWEPLDDGSEKDGWTKRSFKTFTEAVEDSNDGYHWDWNETGLKGKLVGGLFRMEQYIGNDGKIHESSKLKSFTSAENVRSGNYKLPKDKLVEPGNFPQDEMNAGFIDVPTDADDEGLPFR